MLRSNTGFHSVGSRSDLPSWVWLGFVAKGTRVGVIGATMVRGERGGDAGGDVDMVDIEGRDAERGLQESLRRQL